MALYHELGGGEAIEVALDVFHGRVRADPRVGRYFEGVDAGRLKQHQKAFLSAELGGPGTDGGPAGDVGERVSAGRALDDATFDLFMDHFQATLAQMGVPSAKIGDIMAVARRGRDAFLNV